MTPPERFYSKLAVRPTGCIEWTGFQTPKGYGRTQVDGRKFLTHRLAWEAENGPVPGGLYVLHHCDNPPCCNVAHLFLGTIADNNADRDAKGRNNAGVVNRRKTHCPEGHPYDYVHPTGSRRCRTCAHAYQRARKAKLREARNAA